MRDMVPAADGPAPDTLRCRVTPALPGLKLSGAAAFGLLAVIFGAEAVRLVPAVAAALALAAWAVRDLVAPIRLAADRSGVTVVTGYAGRTTLPWDRIERIRVDARPRLGLRTETLEIDTGDTLHLFGPYELGAPVAEVATSLERLRPAR